MAACCTPSVDMAISQTWQPKVTNTIPYNFSSPFCWIEICWIHPRALSELAFGKSGFVLSVCWEDVLGVWRQPKGLFQHKGDYAKNARSVEKGFIEHHVLCHVVAEPIFLKSQVQGFCVRWLASQPVWDNQGILVCQSRKFWLTTILRAAQLRFSRFGLVQIEAYRMKLFEQVGVRCSQEQAMHLQCIYFRPQASRLCKSPRLSKGFKALSMWIHHLFCLF